MKSGKVVYLVKIFVKNGYEKDFIDAVKLNREGTRREPGNIKFDLLQDEQNDSEFMLYEVYESSEAVDAHRKTEHYLKWKETVEIMMEKPREGIRYIPVLADDI